jgi:hypothetical protein
MPRTFRGSLRRSVLLCFLLAAAFGLFAATPNAGQTVPLANATAGSHAAPISVHGATANLANTYISMPFGINGRDLVIPGRSAIQGCGAPWRVQHAGRTLQRGSPHPWVCLLCHLPNSPNL